MASVYQLLLRQIPAHVRDNHPLFCRFVEYYYRWLQTKGFVTLDQCYNIDTNTNAITIKDGTLANIKDYVGFTLTDNDGTLAEVVGYDDNKLIIRYITQDQQFSRNQKIYIKNTSDKVSVDTLNNSATITGIETLPSAFIEHFSKLLDSDQIFGTETPNIATILRNVKDLYQSKGSETALKYLIKITKNVDVDIRYPWENVLKFSDGKWKKQYCITVQADPKHWHSFPIQINKIRLMLDYELENGDIAYNEVAIDKVEIFAQQSENYDTDDQWWIRRPLASYKKDPETGALLFTADDDTYGIWGDRYVTPFIRFYLSSDPNVNVGQEVRIIGTHEENDQQYVQWYGNVVNGINSLKINKRGKGWQVGQIFTAGKDNVWYTYNQPETNHKLPSIAAINSLGVTVDYSQDKPLIGRVTAIDSKGGVTSVEILQYGDHIPQYADKEITVSPLFFNDGTIDESQYQATLTINYQPVSAGTGYFQDMSGWLSCDSIRIQDSDYYQQFSYDIVADVDGSVYQDMANLLHPVGTKMFTTYMIDADLDARSKFDVDVNTAFINVSLFDIVTTTELLSKTITKPLSDSINVEEQLQKIVTKNLKENFGIVDAEKGENVVHNVLDINYDTPAEETKWVEKTVDRTAKKKTSWVDSGTLGVLHINYSHHITQDYLEYNQDPVSSGGYCFIEKDDGISFVSRPGIETFTKSGSTVKIVFKLTNDIQYGLDSVLIVDNASKTVKFKQSLASNGQYTVTFTMPNSDVFIWFNTNINLHNITVPEVANGLLSVNKTKAYYQDTIAVTTTPNNQYTLKSLYYSGAGVGDINITGSKKFSMPNEDVTLKATFVRNGGSIVVTSCDGGDIKFNISDTGFVSAGTTVKLTITPDQQHTLRNIQYQYTLNNEVYQIFLDDSEFVMPETDVQIIVTFDIKQVKIWCQNKFSNSSQGNVEISPTSPTGTWDVGSTVTITAVPGYHTDLISMTANNTTVSNPYTTVLGLSNVNIVANFDGSGGWLYSRMFDETFSGQYSPITPSKDYDTYVKANTTLTLTAPVREGYTFKNFKIFKENPNFDGENINDDNYFTLLNTITTSSYSVKMPRYDVYIGAAEYVINSHKLTIASVAGGTITASSTGIVDYNTPITVKATPNTNYTLQKLVITYNGNTVDITSSKSFDMPDYDVTITPTWKMVTQQMVAYTYNQFYHYDENGNMSTVDDPVIGTYTINNKQYNIQTTNTIAIGATVRLDLTSSQPSKYYTSGLKYTTATNPNTSSGVWTTINDNTFVMPKDKTTVWVRVSRIVKNYTLTKNCYISDSLGLANQKLIQQAFDNLKIGLDGVDDDTVTTTTGKIGSENTVRFADLEPTGVTINNKKLVFDYQQITYSSASTPLVLVKNRQFVMPAEDITIDVTLTYHFE